MKHAAILALALSLVTFAGCAKKKSDSKTESDKSKSVAVNPLLKDLPEKQQVALSKLSEADLKLALAQKKCPVGGDLGSMGTPIKVEHEDFPNQPIFVCCEGCTNDVKKNFKDYLAKIAKQKNEKTK